MPFLAAAIPAIIGGLGAAGTAIGGALPSIAGILGSAVPAITGFTGAGAQVSAANAEVNSGNAAINDWNSAMAAQRGNMAPFLSLGSTSASDLMSALSNGTFGPGSLGPVPNAPGPFTAPTLQDAQNTPGYQFTQQEGDKGILEGAAAAGGAISGGTFKALDSYNTNLANTTYSDVFNRAMQTYESGLQGYQSKLAGYQTGMAAQNQEFQQLYAPSTLGVSSANSLNSNINSGAINIADLMTQIGNAQAGGILGKNAGISTGLGGIPNMLTNIAGLMPGSGGGGFMPYNQAAPFQMPAGPFYSPASIPAPPSGIPNMPTIPGMPDIIGNGLPG